MLKDAMIAVGSRPNRGKGKSAPWWTLKCKYAQSQYKATHTNPERSVQAKNYRKNSSSGKEKILERID